VLLIFIFFELPFMAFDLPAFAAVVLAFLLNTSNYYGETFRAGIESIPRGQTDAALAMGLTPAQVYRYVLLPVSYRIIIPPLTSDFMGIFKNSSVALTIGVLELTAQARTISEYTFRTFEIFTLATVVYVLITMVVTVLMQFVETRVRVPGYIGTGK